LISSPTYFARICTSARIIIEGRTCGPAFGLRAIIFLAFSATTCTFALLINGTIVATFRLLAQIIVRVAYSAGIGCTAARKSSSVTPNATYRLYTLTPRCVTRCDSLFMVTNSAAIVKVRTKTISITGAKISTARRSTVLKNFITFSTGITWVGVAR